jgi:hypothetical protein
MAEEESLLTQEEMEAIGLEPDQVRRPLLPGSDHVTKLALILQSL